MIASAMSTKQRPFWLGLLLVILCLLPFYLATLQTIPNGAEHYYMIDVGETQIVLNRWGTLHATGYPLYVMSGNALVILLRALGISPAAAPGVVSLIWGLTALALIYTLACHLSGRVLPSALMTILLGLTRTVWIHSAIAEIYSFGLVILALLLLIALWRGEVRGRIYWLAFIGGIGVFHHRALIMAAPALIYAVWPELLQLSKRVGALHVTPLPRIVKFLLVCLLLGLLGFLPYLYLPLRANVDAAWVYGEPGTWTGFWDQFLGREADRFIGLPQTLDALIANINSVNTVLITDLTLPGLLLGIFGLALGIHNAKHRRAAITLSLSALVAYLFHILYYTDILSALILPVLVSTAFGWLFLVEFIVPTPTPSPLNGEGTLQRGRGFVFPILVFSSALILITQNLPFIQSLTRDTTGLETIALAETAPPDSTLMLAWGPRHFAVGFAKDVLNQLPNIRLVDHKADFKMLSGNLVTPEYTFYNQPLGWWEQRLGTKVYLNAAAPDLVQIGTQPELEEITSDGVTAIESQVDCVGTRRALSLQIPPQLNLAVAWYTPRKPAYDLSVFVHLLDSNDNIIAQADQSAPVYGWRPLTTWEAREIVRDIYPLPALAEAAGVRFGLYRQLPDGTFENEVEYALDVAC
jgi:hypothetical protein